MLPSDFNCFAWAKIKLGLGSLTGRDLRQSQVGQWVKTTFGLNSIQSKVERAKRVLEEAIELAQSENLPVEEAYNLVHYVYGRPKGDPAQEVAGVGICVLAYCHSKGFSADELEKIELERILAVPKAVFQKRHDIKVAAGTSAAR